MKRLLFTGIFFILPYLLLSSNSSSRIGVHAGINSNYHLHSYFYNNETCCHNYQAKGTGPVLEGLFEKIILPFMSAGLRIGYMNLNAEEMETYNTMIAIIGEGTFDARIDMPLKVEIDAVRVMPSLRFYTSRNFSISLGLGITYISSNYYEIYEQLKYSSDVIFENNSKIRNRRSGEFPFINDLLYSAVFGMAYDFHIDKFMILSPEVKVCFPLNGIQKNIDYDIYTFQAGISVKFAID